MRALRTVTKVVATLVAVLALSSLAVGLIPAPAPALPRLLAAPSATREDAPHLPGFSLRGVTQPWRVGVQVGHLDIQSLPDELARLRGSTGAEFGDVREVDINHAIALHVADLLEREGVVVDLLPARVPPRYDADNKLSAIAADHPDIAEGTDVWALNRGLISITPLRLEVTDDSLLSALSQHTRHLESALERIVAKVP